MNRAAFSVIEVVLATAIFAIFATGAAIALISGLSLNQSAVEQTVANQYAAEGMEATRSIRNQNYANLVNGTYGLGTTGGVWTFSGSQNVFDKYTRTITIADVLRDANGNIATSGGTLDVNTKKIAVNVSWLTGVRSLVTGLTTYLTNWSGDTLTVPGNIGDGLLVYSDGSTTPKGRSFDVATGLFGSENSATVGASARSFALRTSPTKQEAIVSYTDSGGALRVLCYDGTNWSEDWTVNVGGTATTRRFDVAYETNSGKVVVLYSTNAGSNELAFRTKPSSASCGSANWTAATTFDSPGTTGVVHWVKMATDARGSSNLITAIWADANSDLQAAVWDGSTWTQRVSALENSLEVVSAAQDIDDFNVKYESLSGDVMVVWANSAGKNATNGVRYATCPGGSASCTWSAVITPPTFSDDATNLDLSANPSSDEMIFASIGNSGSDLQIGYWSGTAWTDNANVDTSTAAPLAGTKLVATGWLVNGATKRSVVVYNDDNVSNIGWYVCNLGVCTAQSDFVPAALGNPQKWYDVQTDPFNNEQLVLTLSDTNNDLWAKKLSMTSAPAFAWTNADGNAALETGLGQATVSPFGFSYWRLP